MLEQLLLAVLALGTVAIAAAILVDRRRPAPPPRSWLEDATRRRIMVHTTDRQTISGSLVRVDDDGLVLDPARYEDTRTDLAGAAWIPRSRVAWVQEPERPEDEGR